MRVFTHQRKLKVFYWSMSDSKSSPVSRTLLSILTDLRNTVVWLVSIHRPISNAFETFGIVPRALITIGITVIHLFYNFLISQERSKYLSLFLLSLIFTLWFAGMAKSHVRLEFFTSVLADGFSLVFEWQQVSSSLQDSSQYSGRPHQCCRLDSLYPSVQVLQAF